MSALSAATNSKAPLFVSWANAEAAIYACRRWHYSGCVPVFKCVRFGVWEYGKFIGVVLFGQGATPEIGKPFGLEMTEVCELTRVALSRHTTATSRIIAICLRYLKKTNPGLRLVVSFADTGAGHVGGIYQAGNWIYVGESATHAIRCNGTMVHPKTLHSRYGKGGQSIPWLRKHVDPQAERVMLPPKFKYLMPLDDATRCKLACQAKPYPKREKQAMAATSGTAAGQHRPSRSTL